MSSPPARAQHDGGPDWSRRALLAALGAAALAGGLAGSTSWNSSSSPTPTAGAGTTTGAATTSPAGAPATTPAGEPTTSPTTPAATQAADAPIDLVAMSYNTLFGGAYHTNWWPTLPASTLRIQARAPLIAEMIRYRAPDVAGLQENEGSRPLPATYLEPLLPGYSWLHQDASVPIIYRTDRFRALDSGIFPITYPSEPSAHFYRWCSWALLRDHDTHRPFYVYNLHAHPWQERRYAKVRARSWPRLIEGIDRNDPEGTVPLVLLGDFNAYGNETRTLYRRHLDDLAAAGIVDTATIAERDASEVADASSHKGMGANVAGRFVIGAVARGGSYYDYVFTRPDATVLTWEVVTGPHVTWRTVDHQRVPMVSGIQPSDHCPVVAHVQLP